MAAAVAIALGYTEASARWGSFRATHMVHLAINTPDLMNR
jgi:hypothetical protein